jgi:gluconate 2-dehydrogenase gamma chain
MQNDNTSRRNFLRGGVALAGGSWLRYTAPGIAALAQAACSAKEDSAAFAILTAKEAIEFEAIAARILPTTESPGAREAGVIWFFDETFGTFNAGNLQFARSGLAEFQAAIGSGVLFSDLDEAAQDAYLKTQEQTPFFNMIWFMALTGFFGMSKYGGNKNDIGWKLLDVDPGKHAYQSPFGYYDAEYMKEHADD